MAHENYTLTLYYVTRNYSLLYVGISYGQVIITMYACTVCRCIVVYILNYKPYSGQVVFKVKKMTRTYLDCKCHARRSAALSPFQRMHHKMHLLIGLRS